MSQKLEISKTKHKMPPRILIHGVAGIGKSTFAASMPAPIFIQTEDGLTGIDTEAFPLATSVDDVLAQLDHLGTEAHEYKTVVIDSVDWLERLIWDQVALEQGVDNIEKIGFGKGYTFAMNIWRQIMERLEALRSIKGMIIVLIAHTEVKKHQDPLLDSYDRYAVSLHKNAQAYLIEACDIVGFANYQVHTKKTDEGFGNKKTKGVGTGERILYLEERPGFLAKNRFGLPSEIPFDYASLMASF